MSADQKRDFHDQSKIDRERFEKERQEYVNNKGNEGGEAAVPSVLETVKQRSQILKQQQEKKQRYEDYVETLLPQKRTRRARKNSDKQAILNEENGQEVDYD